MSPVLPSLQSKIERHFLEVLLVLVAIIGLGYLLVSRTSDIDYGVVGITCKGQVDEKTIDVTARVIYRTDIRVYEIQQNGVTFWFPVAVCSMQSTTNNSNSLP